MKKFTKTLAVVLALSMAGPSLAPTAFANEVQQITDLAGGSSADLMEVSFKKPYSDGYFDTIHIDSAGPYGHEGYYVNLREYADALKDSEDALDFEIKDNTIEITHGKNYNGGYEKLTKTDAYNYKSRTMKLVDGDRVEEIEVYNIFGKDLFIRYGDLLGKIHHREAYKRETMTKGLLNKKIEAADYTLINTWDGYASKTDILKTKQVTDLYNLAKANNKYTINFLSLITNGELFPEEEFALKFYNQKPAFESYNINDEMYEYLNNRFSSNFGNLILVDKTGKQVGESFDSYYETYKDLYMKENNVSEAVFNSTYDYVSPIIGEIHGIIYENFLDYTINGKKVTLAPKHQKKAKQSKEDLLKQKQTLQKAIEDNKIKVSSANFLLEHTPKTIAPVKDKLLGLIKKSEDIQAKANKALADLEKRLAN